MRPKILGMLGKGENHNLLGSLKKTQVMGHTAWSAQFKNQRIYTTKSPFCRIADSGNCLIEHRF
jgi:hypothetical protein